MLPPIIPRLSGKRRILAGGGGKDTTLEVKNKRELKRWTDKSYKQQIEDMPEADVMKDILKRLDKLETTVASQDKHIKALEGQCNPMWKDYCEQQRREALLQPDGGEEGF